MANNRPIRVKGADSTPAITLNRAGFLSDFAEEYFIIVAMISMSYHTKIVQQEIKLTKEIHP